MFIIARLLTLHQDITMPKVANGTRKMECLNYGSWEQKPTIENDDGDDEKTTELVFRRFRI